MSPQPDVALSRCGQDGLPKEFHPAVVLDNTWGSSQPEMGTGLVNLGNTCFLNAVLQCLVGTPTIMNLIASPYSHSNLVSRHNLEEDWYKTFETSLLKMINSQGKSLRPTPFTKSVGQVIKSHRPGEQEDAHEYLVNLLEKLHTHAMEAYAHIHGFKFEKQWARTHRHLELTSSINQIFAGIIRSQVLCKNCGSASNTYDPFTDLSLELQDCQRVSDCLHQFTKPEYLGLSNAYLCGKCKRKSEASKQLTIHTLPNILVLQLKRFSFMGMQGSKISTHIAYDFEIDMGRYLSRKVPSGDKACIYDLYAVLVHRGSSAHCGHYYAYVKHKGNRWFKLDDSQWFKLDDSQILPAPANEVLQQSAYILFYARRVPRSESLVAPLLDGLGSPKQQPVRDKSNAGANSPAVTSPLSAHRAAPPTLVLKSPVSPAALFAPAKCENRGNNIIGPALPPALQTPPSKERDRGAA